MRTIQDLIQLKDDLPLIYAVNYENQTKFNLREFSLAALSPDRARVCFRAGYNMRNSDVEFSGSVEVEQSASIYSVASTISQAFIIDELLSGVIS